MVVTGDIPLAARCVADGARVVKHNGEVLNAANIGMVLASRDLAADLRAADPFRQGGGRRLFQGRPLALPRHARPRDPRGAGRLSACRGQDRRRRRRRGICCHVTNRPFPARRLALIGILSAVGGSLVFSVNDVAIKFLSGDYALHEVVLIRSSIGHAW